VTLFREQKHKEIRGLAGGFLRSLDDGGGISSTEISRKKYLKMVQGGFLR